MSNFPKNIDTDAELYKVADDTDEVIAAHHNALAEAVKAIEEKLGVDGSAIVESFDYILKQLAIKSVPAQGGQRVVNMFVNADGKLHVDYDDGGD
uniref:Uncharacterized protein n=1 Tax=viral metagenome TaxID=1070528 RepID=A0A6M3II07_9ZZZZ